LIDDMIKTLKDAEEKAKETVALAAKEAEEILEKAGRDAKEIVKSADTEKDKMKKITVERAEKEAAKLGAGYKKETEKQMKKVKDDYENKRASIVDMITERIFE